MGTGVCYAQWNGTVPREKKERAEQSSPSLSKHWVDRAGHFVFVEDDEKYIWKGRKHYEIILYRHM